MRFILPKRQECFNIEQLHSNGDLKCIQTILNLYKSNCQKILFRTEAHDCAKFLFCFFFKSKKKNFFCNNEGYYNTKPNDLAHFSGHYLHTSIIWETGL